MTGTYVFKHGFERLRPCNDPEFTDHVRLVIKHCGGGYSFLSNHAANHFGMAVFFFITLRHVFRKWAWLVFVWAGLIAFAQVYVGVHYPLDVLCGALLGMVFGIAQVHFSISGLDSLSSKINLLQINGDFHTAGPDFHQWLIRDVGNSACIGP